MKTKTCKNSDCGEEYQSNGIDPCSGLCPSCCYNKRNATKKKYEIKRTPIKRAPLRKQKTYFKKSNNNKAKQARKFRKYVEAKAAHDCEKWGELRCCITGAFICKQGDDYSKIQGMCCSHILEGSQGKKYYWILDASVWMTPEIHNKWQFGDKEVREEMENICPEICRRREWLLSLTDEQIQKLSL
jgi:hypothetical protein